MNSQQHNAAIDALLQAVNWLCRPLIRLLIAKGIGYPQLREHLKGLYVEVAEQEFGLDGKPPSDSRIYLLTGVHRKDIKRLRGQAKEERAPGTAAASLGGAIVARWLGLPEYLDADGKPRCLPRKGEAGQPGFDELVSSVSKDVRPRTVLDEWLRLGMVSLNEAGAICLDRSAFVPDQDFAEQAFFLGRNVHDHLAACVHNMIEAGPPMLERSVYYAALRAESVQQLRELAEREGMAVLETINQRALELQQADAGRDDANRRMRFGCYWYDTKKQSDEEAEE
jgi:hypothetical protein